MACLYLNGELNGKSEWFSEDNLILRESVYKQGKLQGLTKNYDKKGLVASEGNYKDDKKVGIWKYYKDGKITKEIDHTTSAQRLRDLLRTGLLRHTDLRDHPDRP